jgi:hypothetical protein
MHPHHVFRMRSTSDLANSPMAMCVISLRLAAATHSRASMMI